MRSSPRSLARRARTLRVVVPTLVTVTVTVASRHRPSVVVVAGRRALTPNGSHRPPRRARILFFVFLFFFRGNTSTTGRAVSRGPRRRVGGSVVDARRFPKPYIWKSTRPDPACGREIAARERRARGMESCVPPPARPGCECGA